MKLSICHLNVFTLVSITVRMMARLSNHIPTSAQIQNIKIQTNSLVIQGFHNVNEPAACDIARSMNTQANITTGR